MDDKVSIKSSDSVTTSGEYEIVLDELEKEITSPLGTSPTLNIANNGNLNDLEKDLTEVIHELDQTVIHATEFGQPSQQTTDKGKMLGCYCRAVYLFCFTVNANSFVV